ncbi:MAG TPA: M15 family metallopeptidase [Prosthecobacter sp.]|nr:M15 family metallopeptidase [Prosthecobacter sp.]
MPRLRCLCLILAAFLTACAGTKETHNTAAMRERTLQRAMAQGLVDVAAVIPGIDIDLRYSTANNITRRPLYPSYMPCLLLASTAERLRHAQSLLNAQGYALRVWDAWRPPEVQDRLNDASGRTGLFLDPDVGWSRHCGGISVDATLIDLHGHEQRMPTAFDDKLGPSATDYTGGDPVVRRNLAILHTAMRTAGLIPLADEWWHFDNIDHIKSPVPIIRGPQIGVIVR